MFSSVLASLRQILARPASLLAVAAAFFLASLTSVACVGLLAARLRLWLWGAPPPSPALSLGLLVTVVCAWAATWPLLGAALAHIEGRDPGPLFPRPRTAPMLFVLGLVAISSGLLFLLLLSTSFVLLAAPIAPLLRALSFALVAAAAFALLFVAQCAALAALPAIAEEGWRGFVAMLRAVLAAPQRSLGVVASSALLLLPLLVLSLPVGVAAVRWPPSPASLLLLLVFSLCTAPLPLLVAKALFVANTTPVAPKVHCTPGGE